MRRGTIISAAAFVAVAIVLCGAGSYQPSSWSRGSYGGPGSTFIGGAPPSGYWNGCKHVLIWEADDGYRGNLAWSQMADSLDVTYTLSTSWAPDHYGIGNVADGMLTTAELATVASRGVDVGSGGAHHRPYGVLDHVYTNATAYPDSFTAYMAVGYNYPYTGTLARTWGVDLYYWNYFASKKLRALNYLASSGGRWFFGNADYLTAERERGFVAWGSPGWDRYDLSRLLPWDDVGSIYNIGTWPAEGDANSRSIFGPVAAGGTAAATIRANMQAAIDSSAAHGYAPIIVTMHGYTVTREDLETAITYARSQGCWVTSLREAANWYRARHVPRDPPYWAYQAKLDGITAADEIFWGPPAPPAISWSAATTDSFIFSPYTAAVTRANYTGQVNTGHAYGRWSALNPSTRQTSSYNGFYAATPPLDGYGGYGDDAIGMGFNIASLAGKTVVYAQLHYYVASWASLASMAVNEMNYGVIIGVTNPNILPYMANVTGRGVWTYSYRDSAQTQAWPVAINTLMRFPDWGPYVYAADPAAKFNGAAGWNMMDVTEYVQKMISNGSSNAGFVYWGLKGTGGYQYCEVASFPATNTVRPYLVVRTLK